MSRAVPGRRRLRRGGASRGERGSAVVEFVVLGVPLLVPLVYLAVAAAIAQRAAVGVTEAARQAGRAYVTGTAATAPARAAAAAAAVRPGAEVRYSAGGCGAAAPVPPALTPGRSITVCVRERVPVLGLDRTVTGRFTAHVDRYRDHG